MSVEQFSATEGTVAVATLCWYHMKVKINHDV